MSSSAMTEAAILDLYFARDEQAITETDRLCGRAAMQLSENILHSRPDAEECVSDTYLKVWNTVPPTRPTSLRGYVLHIVRNLSLNRLRDLTAAKRSRDLTVSFEELEECLSVKDEYASSLATLLSDFLRTREPLDRRLFVGRYWYAIPVKDLAAEHSMTANAVTLNLRRTRERLRTYLSEGGYTV